METVVCNLCGSDSSQTVYEIADWLMERPEVKTTLVQCRRCNLIYQNPRPTLQEIGQHYPPEYEPFHSYEHTGVSWLIKKAIEYGFDNRAREVVNIGQGGKLLDVGCAAGDFLHHVQKKYHWQVQGVEISKFASDLARKKYGLDVFTGTLEQASFLDNSFDAVTLWDVLEHLHDPTGTLKEVLRILRPGGTLALRVPNAASFDARLFGPYWSGLDSPRHLYVFQKQTIQMLLEKTGFQLASATSKYGSYLSFVLSFRLWMTSKDIKPSIRNAIVSALYHPVARIVSSPLFYLYSLPQKTSQLMIKAVKK